MLGHLLNLGETPYLEAWELQRSMAAQVLEGALPDTVILLEHSPVVTLGRRAEAGELHVPDGAEVEIVETDRGSDRGGRTVRARGDADRRPHRRVARAGTQPLWHVADKRPERGQCA